MSNSTCLESAGTLLGVKVYCPESIEVGTVVKFIGVDNYQVEAAGSGDVVAGYLYSVPNQFPGWGVMTTRYTEKREVLFSGAVTPGTLVKMGVTTEAGVQTFAAWDSVNDLPTLIVGMAMTGATDDTGEILTN